MPNKEAVIAKFKETLSSYKIAYDQHKKSKEEKADPLIEHQLNLELTAHSAKLKLFYKKIKETVPKEKRAEVNVLLEEVYKKSFASVSSFESNLKMLQKLTPKAQMEEYFFHRDVPAMIYERGLGEDFFNVLLDYADVSQLDALEAAIDSYQAPQLTNFKVYPLKEQVEALKKKNAESMQNSEKLNALNEELERISNLVVTSTEEYSTANGDAVEKIYSAKISKATDECNKRNVHSDKYKHVGEYLVLVPETGSDALNGTCQITDAHKEDIHLHEVFSRDDVKLQVSEDKKEALRNIVKFMKSCGLLDRDQSMGEAGDKIYSFSQIHAADKKLKELLNRESQDLNAYREAREEYERALENMRQIYKMIEEQIKPTNEMMVGNVSSFREDWIPNEFKDSLLINSYANSIYNLALVIHNGELDLDEFLENPNKGCIDAMGKLSDLLSPGTVMGKMSMGAAICMALSNDEYKGYPALTISRSAELLLQLSGGTDAYEHNAMASLVISSYEFHVQQGFQQNKRVGFAGYSHKSPLQTVANILLVNDADRDYNKLRTFEALTGDFKATIPPFHTMEYLERNVVDPDAFLKRITDVIDELSVKNEDGMHLTDASTRACVLRGAQLAAHQFLLTHPVPDEVFFKEETFNSLKQIVDSPETVFENIMSKDLKKELREYYTLKEYVSTSNRDGKKALKDARKEARTAEEAYAARVKQIEETKTGADAEKALADLRAEEIARLEKAYLNGKLPKDYLDERRFNVSQGEHEKRVPFGASERPSFNTFKKGYEEELLGGELNEEEVRMFYDRMMENARISEKQFILTAAGKMPRPTLESPEPEKVEAVEPIKESIDVLNDIKDTVTELSKPIVVQSPQSLKEKGL